MNSKILFFFLSLLLLSNKNFAQPVLFIEELNYNFEQIAEGAIAKHDFVIKNTGDKPLVINSVRASCGCTTPFWTKEPILPGQSGIVSAAYNSQNRPGAFKKSISVFTNAVKPVKTLYIQGVVVNKPIKESYTAEEKANSAKIAASTLILAGKIEMGQKVPLSLKIKNEGENPLVINAIRAGCNCIIWDNYNKEPITKGEEETLKLIYTPRSLGIKNEPFIIYSNDITQSQLKVEIKAEIVHSLDQNSPIKQTENIQF